MKRTARKTLAIILIITTALIAWLVFFPQKAGNTAEPEVLAEQTDSLLVIVNRVRAENGCERPLVINSQLTKAAQERAEYVADGHWSHDGYIETVKKYYRYQKLGENLARDFRTEEALVQAWLNSPKHRDNLLNCKYIETGIGRSGTVVAQEYGKK